MGPGSLSDLTKLAAIRGLAVGFAERVRMPAKLGQLLYVPANSSRHGGKLHAAI